MMATERIASVNIALPAWIDQVVDWTHRYQSAEDRVQLAITLARENVERLTGGPFGAAVFSAESQRVISVGVNLVEPENNAALHAEVVALMFAQRALASFTLASPPLAESHILATSCAPCAMCLGAVHWSGVTRVEGGATREDALAIGFDEGPVFPESIGYLERRGITFVDGIARTQARDVLQRYQTLGRALYNA